MDDAPTTDEIALAWAIRTAHPDFHEWDAFLAWLGGDPARNLAYDRAMAMVLDASAGAAVSHAAVATAPAPAPTAAIVPLPSRRAQGRQASGGRPRWAWIAAGTAIAASVVGVVAIRPSDHARSLHIVETAPGRARTIATTDGSRIELAGGSRLQLDDARARWARVDRGHAVFRVRHDAAAPFRVDAGSYRIVDDGTTFEVARDRASTRVAVAEGRVIVDPATVGIRLEAGQAADLVTGLAPRVEQVSPAAVGQWRHARLRYDDAPLATVAADLSIVLGHPIVVDASVRERRFNGTITPATLAGKPEEAAALLSIRVVPGPHGWEFRSR